MEHNKILLKRSSDVIDNIPKVPTSEQLEYGEIAVNYASGFETISLKNDSNQIVEFKSKEYFESKIQKLFTDTELKFYCIEPVSVQINDETMVYPANTYVDLFLRTTDRFEVLPLSDSSITLLSAYPGAISTFYSWLEGVQVFDGILFDMNDLSMYEKWNQGHQGEYHVQMAQYNNCIFWSDNAYISDINSRTNYTLYNSSQLPLCYSRIPDNTYKAFYSAYGVKNDPNWSNPAYRESFAIANYATQTFSYYGATTIGVFNMDSDLFNIRLPKDCRGLMFYSPTIENAGIFDAVNVTNFGAKSGSWRDAFGYCYKLTNLYIKNLKVNINVSWSPISQDSLNYILSRATNTKKITIYLSPETYYSLTEDNISIASEKNIALELISTNVSEDKRLKLIKTNGEGTLFLTDDGTYKEILIPTHTSQLINDSEFINVTEMGDFEINAGEY